MTGQRKKRGIRLAVWGLVLGVLFGTGVRLLERFIASSLIDLLRDEARASCACDFQIDSIKMSLLTMSARAKNARVLFNGKPALTVKNLRATFRPFERILKRKIVLKHLLLDDIDVDGVGAESGTFLFINHLAEPLDPSKDHPLKFTVSLMNMTVQNAHVQQHVGGAKVEGFDVGLTYQRDDSDNLVLHPHAAKLVYASSEEEPIELGQLESELYITDDSIEFRTLALQAQDILSQVTATVFPQDGHRLEGKLSVKVGEKAKVFPPWLSVPLSAQADLGGTFSSPTAEGSFQIPADHSARIQISETPLLEFQQGAGSFSFNEHSGLEVPTLSFSGPTTELHLQEPLVLQGDTARGAARFQLQELRLGQTVIGDIDLVAKLESTPQNSLAVSIGGTVGRVQGFDYRTPPVSLRATVSSEKFKVSLSHSSPQFGAFSIQGDGSLQGGPESNQFQFQFENFAIPKVLESRLDSESDPLRISGSGALSGGLSLSDLSGAAEISLSSPDFSGEAALRGEATLKNQRVSLQIGNDSKSIEASLQLPLDETVSERGLLHLELRDFRPQEYDPSLSCILLDLSADYSFEAVAPWEGEGNVELRKATVGCSPHTLGLSAPASLSINLGSIQLRDLLWKGRDAGLRISGTVGIPEGYDLALSGEIDLESLLPYASSIDDLRGKTLIQAHVGGSFEAPRFGGSAKIEGGELSLEKANMSLSHVEGTLEIEPERINIRDISGTLNGGSFNLSGEVFPFTLEHSNLGLSFQDFFIEPESELQASLSGELFLTQGEADRPALAGTVTVDFAELKKSFDLLSLLRSLPSYLLSNSKTRESTSTQNLPAVDLDVRVKADRNVFILTTFLGAELNGDLYVRGQLSDPKVIGTLQTLNGWFGLRDTRFQITSGQVTLGTLQPEPQLDVVSETYASSIGGDDTLIILEAKGPLDSPKITLSSNRGLTQNEILSLVSSGRVGIQQDESRFFTSGLRLQETEEKAEGIERLIQLFRRLTRIDNITVNPKVNSRRGTVEPALLAEKHLLPRLDLLGETFLSGSGDEALLSLRYELTDKLNLLGTADTITAEDTTALGADLEYVILERQGTLTNYTFTGNSSLSSSEILEELRLSKLSRIQISSVPNLANQVVALYRARGFLQSTATTACLDGRYYCRSIGINIEEGPISKIAELRFTGEPLPADAVKPPKSPQGDEATFETRDRYVQDLTRALRTEGYLQARVNAAYEAVETKSNEVSLTIDLRTGPPVSFIFEGNTVFSAEDFLKTINLFDRKLPFGNNTIHILIENMDKLYRGAGYLFATIRFEKETAPDTKRTTYRITISEEKSAAVSQVQFLGNSSFPGEQLRELIANNPDKELVAEIFTPKVAVLEDLQAHAQLLEGVYEEQGFPEVSIEPGIVPDPNEPVVRITYTVHEGFRQISQDIQVQGFPSAIVLPSLPAAPYSIPKVNRYILTLLDRLKAAGYIHAQIRSEWSEQVAQIFVKPEARHSLREVILRGNQEIASEVILSQLRLTKGMAWDDEVLAEARRRLLRLGVFSRVSFQRDEVTPDESDLIVRLSERPLQTLELGTGINSEFGLHLFGEATDRSLFADGRTLSLRFDTYYDDTKAEISRGLASLRFVDPSLFEERYVFSNELRYQKLNLSTQEFDLDRISFLTFLFRDFSHGLSGNLGHTIFQEDLNDVSPGAVIGDFDEGVVDLSILSGNLLYDQRSDPLNPLSGYRLRFDWSLSSKAIASDADYFSFGGQGSYTLPFEARQERFALATRLLGASAWTFGGTDEIPISQRYYAGGRNTVRGFRENSLGPRGFDGAVIGGDLVLTSNNEFRYFLNDALSTHLFFDLGTVFLKEESTDLHNLRRSTGVGIRYLSAIGPIGFDIGKPLDEKEGEPSVRVHFSLGTNF